MTTQREVIDQLLSDICSLAHRHEVQYWLDAPGTPEERLRDILKLAREALHVHRTGETVAASEAPHA